MRLVSNRHSSFRGLVDEEHEFSNINLVLGNNGDGKTSLLEARFVDRLEVNDRSSLNVMRVKAIPTDVSVRSCMIIWRSEQRRGLFAFRGMYSLHTPFAIFQ